MEQLTFPTIKAPPILFACHSGWYLRAFYCVYDRLFGMKGKSCASNFYNLFYRFAMTPNFSKRYPRAKTILQRLTLKMRFVNFHRVTAQTSNRIVNVIRVATGGQGPTSSPILGISTVLDGKVEEVPVVSDWRNVRRKLTQICKANCKATIFTVILIAI